MLRLTPGNITRLRPDLSIWRQGHLDLASAGEQLCYFWSRETQLITRDNIEEFHCPLVAHPTDHPSYVDPVTYIGRFDIKRMGGHHLYRLCVEPGCVAAPRGHAFQFNRVGLREYGTIGLRMFIRPDGVMPIEVTYLGTVSHED
ncbi:hypothetical protein [Stenotrophomonas sp. GD03657]|uniref:hypothetical protein n=1 Tax=Stenotrophomonas sp. GD03657 TaxID=2975363 RepID=UPI002449556A|nr:hypothetical protein [Stenotrophomonas sp. GD03657]MDH2154189.1 hypothetical protein [Stenotrophomonas sp. GD03657]